MTTRPYGLPERLMAFFEANPDEELTCEQIALKFGVSIGRARTVLCILAADGELENVRVVRLPSRGRATSE